MSFFVLGIALVSSGCNFTPKYVRPEAPVPAEWPSGPAYANAQPTTTAPEAPDLKWQEFFADPKLQRLIETALTNNRDLRLAALNVERARALYGIRRAELLPTVDATASGNLQRYPASISPTGTAATVEQYRVHLGVLAWEPDFFGRIRSLNERALQEYFATARPAAVPRSCWCRRLPMPIWSWPRIERAWPWPKLLWRRSRALTG